MTKQKVIIIGSGMVGASAAFALGLRESIEEIILIDINEKLAWGQAADINDALGHSDSVRVRQGTYSDISDDDIVVITSGAPQKPDQSRLELLDSNAKIMRDVVSQVMEGGVKPFLLIVANPVDALTYVALKASGLPRSRVFGTGTTLDTYRLRVELANQLNVSPSEVEAYVLGEHGDSSFVAIESAQIGDIPLDHYPGFRPEMIKAIDESVRGRVYKIIEAKGSTYFAIGSVVAQITEAILHDSAHIYPVCSLVDGEYGLHDVVLGLPSSVSSQGVKIINGYELPAHDRCALEKSAEIVKAAISSLT